MKKNQNLYVLGAVLVLVGGFMYIAKNKANKVNIAPPMEAEDTTSPEPTPASSGNTLSGASQVIDSLKGLLAEIKNKSLKTIQPAT